MSKQEAMLIFRIHIKMIKQIIKEFLDYFIETGAFALAIFFIYLSGHEAIAIMFIALEIRIIRNKLD